jgi:hypothetical protein
MPPVLTGGDMRCSRLFGEVGHYASNVLAVSNDAVKLAPVAACTPELSRLHVEACRHSWRRLAQRTQGGDDPR